MEFIISNMTNCAKSVSYYYHNPGPEFVIDDPECVIDDVILLMYYNGLIGLKTIKL